MSKRDILEEVGTAYNVAGIWDQLSLSARWRVLNRIGLPRSDDKLARDWAMLTPFDRSEITKLCDQVHGRLHTVDNYGERKKAESKDARPTHAFGHELDPRTLTPVRHTIDTTVTGDYGADPLGDGKFRMVPSGDVVDWDERNRRLAKKPK